MNGEKGLPAASGSRSVPERQLWDLPLTWQGDGIQMASSRQCHHVDPDLQQGLPTVVGALEREGRMGMGSMRALREEVQSLSLPDAGCSRNGEKAH